MITSDQNKESIIAKLIEWSINNKFLVIIFTLAFIAAGVWAVSETAVDAIPDLSDVQVIIYTEYQGQGPQIVENQVTYPLTTKMLSVPFAQTVRGYSFFGFSMVYIIFEDGTDIYWARSRVLEYLSSLRNDLPACCHRAGPQRDTRSRTLCTGPLHARPGHRYRPRPTRCAERRPAFPAYTRHWRSGGARKL